MPARKVTVEIRKQGEAGPGTYALRSTFPPKPGSNRSRPYRQRLYTGIPAVRENKKRVTALARRVEAALLEGTFDWAEFEEGPAEETDRSGLTIQQLIPGLHRHLVETRGITQTTWESKYLHRLRVRPGLEASLEPEVIEAALRATAKSSHARRADVHALRILATYAGVDFDFAPWASSYNPRSVRPISVPTDEEIMRHIDSLTNPGHRWLIGAIATWGLRPHEAWLLSVTEGSTRAEVHERTKTGRRIVPAMPADWVERWDLSNKVLPVWTIPDTDDYAAAVAARLKNIVRRGRTSFRLYALRHAFAVRAFKRGVPVATAAKVMGHSPAVHANTYQRWVDEAEVVEAFEGFS